jgi:general secretion pathway protein E
MAASFESLVSAASRVTHEGPWRLLTLAVLGTWSLWLLLGLAQWATTFHRRRRILHSELTAGPTVTATLLALSQRLARLIGSRESTTIEILQEILLAALLVESSDIHVSPIADGYEITLRADGTLYKVHHLPTAVGQALVNRIKVLARLDLHIRSVPQDGRLATAIQGVDIEARVSTLPTETGERAVLRLVAGVRGLPSLPRLGLISETQQRLQSLLSRPQGLLVVTGPVGSGKSTTLYACLAHIATTRGHTSSIVTLEDPVELRLPFATQTQMNSRTGMTFAGTLRSVLRQDPNVLMVGEIRDRETADIALQAGLTGHLILTTIHSDSAPGTFARLVEMGLEPYLLASSILGILSQRLVRTLCPMCRRPTPVTTTQRDQCRDVGVELAESTYFEAVGCPECDNQGFLGRTPLVELLVVGPEVRQAIIDHLPTNRIRSVAIQAGLVPLIQDGLRLAQSGRTSLSEVLRVAE